MASKPVANTMMSHSYSLPPARMPFAVISSIASVGRRIDQQHVVLVEGLVVVGVERLALGAVGVPLGYQLLGHLTGSFTVLRILRLM